MSIDKVEVTNSQGSMLALTLEDVSNGYVVEDIDGIGPVNATIVSSNFATMKGQQYQASSIDIRNITIKLGYDPDYSTNQTVLGLRTALYRYFMTGMLVDLAFYMADGAVVNIEGRVERCQPAIFTREPQMDISIVCMNPDFVDITPVVLSGIFTTTDDEARTVYVIGSADTGLNSLTFTAPKALSGFSIYHTLPSGELRSMLVSAPLVLGDVVNLRSIPGEKSITMTRDNVTTSLMWAVSPQSLWPLLAPGENGLYLNASTTDPAPVTIEYNNRYGGL